MEIILNLFLQDLDSRGKALVDPDKLYHSGRFTGALNKLDQNSPHVSKSPEEALKWYHEGLRLIYEQTQI